MAITTLPNTKGLNVTRYLAVYDRFDEIREAWNSKEVQQLVKDINKRAAFQKFIFPRFFYNFLSCLILFNPYHYFTLSYSFPYHYFFLGLTFFLFLGFTFWD